MKKDCMDSLIRRLLFIVGILMLIQIICGFVWMTVNIRVVPGFGDSAEYMELSRTLKLDEYRPILYPLILRWMPGMKSDNPVLLYLFQTVISFASLFYGVYTADQAVLKNKCSEKRTGCQLFFSLYLLTIPMITFMNFSVLTDSLATSLLVIFLSGCIQLLGQEQIPIRICVSIALSLIGESLLRADRLYSCLLLTVIVFLVWMVRNRGYRKRVFITALLLCVSVTAIVKVTDHFTQTPGLNNRVRTDFSFVLLDRIVWPNMEANYPFFSEEIQNTISLEDAKLFDQHNNNVMYQLAPMVESKVGKKKAGDMYCEMAKVVFFHQTKKVLLDIGEDILSMAATPFSSMLNVHNLCRKGDSWNIYCMSSKTPKLTVFYNQFYQASFLFLILLGLLICIWRRNHQITSNTGAALRVLLPYIGMSLILTLWFSLGDGAPPNDRYAMIIYITWAMVGRALLYI